MCVTSIGKPYIRKHPFIHGLHYYYFLMCYIAFSDFFVDLCGIYKKILFFYFAYIASCFVVYQFVVYIDSLVFIFCIFLLRHDWVREKDLAKELDLKRKELEPVLHFLQEENFIRREVPQRVCFL